MNKVGLAEILNASSGQATHLPAELTAHWEPDVVPDVMSGSPELITAKVFRSE
ncbi:MAG: hypothetical protein K2X81_01620 [Candidatus Obscuribacterales bacterium]|nr:hypothetical protein [Candidatus Obscuribacterales bacterium]